jgi:thiol:disulfide interchange protein
MLGSFQIPGVPNPYTLESAMRTRLYGHESPHWKPYSAAAFEAARESGKVVIVEFTADWCVNCHVLAETVLHSQPILTMLEEKQIISLVGDCTREGEDKELLMQLGPFIVPTLAIFDPAQPTKPKMIRGGYTQKTLMKELR